VAKPIKKWIRRTIGLWPALEMRNRILMAYRLPGLTRFERREVKRLSRQLDAVPAAKIACIIPTYKRPDGLLNAINSVLAQRYQDFVVMVIDDGAGLPELPNDPRLFAVSLSRNCGIAGLVRNVGIRLTHSDVIAFLDDDNVWRPDHLSKAMAAIDLGGDLVYTAVRRRRPDGSQLDILSKPFDRRAFSNESAWVDTNAIVLRRKVCPLFSRLHRPRWMLPREDWEFVWQVSARSKVEHIPAITVEYLANPDSFYTLWKPTTLS
jgi:glycosyltransferase involved in cell wall biosynthesis